MNDLLLIRKQTLFNSLNNIINSNKNLFESHKFNLVHNHPTSLQSTASGASASTSLIVSFLIINCLLSVNQLEIDLINMF